MIRVLVADDEAIVRSGLRLTLELEDDIDVIGEATDGIQAIEQARRLRPDILLLDVRMPRMDGVTATRQLVEHHPQIRIVVLTTFDDDAVVEGALRAGASGFVLKVAPPEQLLLTIRTVAAGEALIDPKVTKRVIAAFAGSTPPTKAAHPGLDELTQRELDVLALLARGLTNDEIASTLVISHATAKSHVARIFTKLAIHDRVQAVILAYEHGIVRPGDE